jgi:type IV secretion system protein VirB6
MQQGGIGLLMTVLIVSSPPLAAMFFQGTVGNFLTYSAFGMGHSSKLGPQGQPPGSYAAGGSAPLMASTAHAHAGNQGGTGGFSERNAATRGSIVAGPAQSDAIRHQPPITRG